MRKTGQFRMAMFTVPADRTEKFRDAVKQSAAALKLDCRVLEFETPSGSTFVVAVNAEAPWAAVETFFELLGGVADES